MKKITFNYTLTDEQIDKIARSFGYTDTISKINNETGEWTAIPNPTTPLQFAIKEVSKLINNRIQPVFAEEAKSELKTQAEIIDNQISQTIASQQEVTVEDITI